MKTSKDILKDYCGAAAYKVAMSKTKLLVSGMFAGAFIAFGAFGSQVAAASFLDPGLGRFIGACVFATGLSMVVIVGAELFTGNSLLMTALLEKKITAGAMLRSWGIVYLGNLIGAAVVAALVVTSQLPGMFDGALAQTMVSTALAKGHLTFIDGLFRGILCNVLVCLAVWMNLFASEPGGKIAALFLPTMLFVLCGFEHCVANMYFIPAGFMTSKIYAIPSDVSTLRYIFSNLLPVTIGNIIGGAGIVAWGLHFLYGERTHS